MFTIPTFFLLVQVSIFCVWFCPVLFGLGVGNVCARWCLRGVQSVLGSAGCGRALFLWCPIKPCIGQGLIKSPHWESVLCEAHHISRTDPFKRNDAGCPGIWIFFLTGPCRQGFCCEEWSWVTDWTISFSEIPAHCQTDTCSQREKSSELCNPFLICLWSNQSSVPFSGRGWCLWHKVSHGAIWWNLSGTIFWEVGVLCVTRISAMVLLLSSKHFFLCFCGFFICLRISYNRLMESFQLVGLR